MSKVYAAARLLAIIAAIAAAFVAIPNLTEQNVAAILIVLGIIAGVGNTPEENTKVYLVTLILIAGSAALSDIPTAGTYLTAIFANLGKAFLGASFAGLVLGLSRKVISDWTAKKA